MLSLLFYINAIVFGVGLAMDAFSVSLANGLNEPKMKNSKALYISAAFGFFQFAMPLIGWICVHFLVETFTQFSKFIPWIALVLLLYIGGGMLKEAFSKDDKEEEKTGLDFKGLMIQSIATSIDALSVGFTIAELSFVPAFIESFIIGITTMAISYFGILIGKKFGTKFEKPASIMGGIILILIGIEIFVEGVILV